jgi:hypothetical protein
LHAKGDDFIFLGVVFLGLMALVVATLFKYGLYTRRTPLARIDETSLIFFGNAQSEQRSFPRHAISHISLSRRPSFWRSAYCFSVVADGETVKLWIPHACRTGVASLNRALREQFPGKFEEIPT